VRDFHTEKEPTGFKFKRYSVSALTLAVASAVKVFKDKKAWRELQKNAMEEDFSWSRSAKRYLELYELAMKKKGVRMDIWGKKAKKR